MPIDPSSPASPAGAELAPGLYLVATPLGNLGDITRRALAILAQVDLVACEDTRMTRQLYAALGLRAPRLIRADAHHETRVAREIIEAVNHGKRVALVSDAGTPAIADPGSALVRLARQAGITVSAAPGPSALAMAVSLAGLPAERFVFLGFLPAKAGEREAALRDFAGVKAALVAFEAPGRLAACLAAMAKVLGAREAVVLRELTKRFEEVRPGTLDQLARHYDDAGAPKGEIVIVVAPPARDNAPPDEAAIDARLDAALATMSLRDAAAFVAEALGLPRRVVYARALERRS